MRIKIYITAALLALYSQSCLAGQGDIGATVKGGTLGLGAEMSVGLSDDTDLRGGVNFLSFRFDSTINDIDYSMETRFKNGSLLLDWHPFSGAFRLTGGLYINGNEIEVDGLYRNDLLPPEYRQYGALTDLAHIKGTVEFNAIAPFLGFGWITNHGEKGWGVAFDAGILFQGAPTVSDLYIDSPGLQTPANVIPFLNEQKKEIEDDLKQFQYYPSASISLTYNF